MSRTVLCPVPSSSPVHWQGQSVLGKVFSEGPLQSYLLLGCSRERPSHLQKGVTDARHAVLRGVSCGHQSPEDLHQLWHHLQLGHTALPGGPAS